MPGTYKVYWNALAKDPRVTEEFFLFTVTGKQSSLSAHSGSRWYFPR
jgi:hypothetical protein